MSDVAAPGPATRALLWVLGGLVVAVLLAIGIAPELLGDLRVAGQVALLAAAAGIPGLVILVVVGVRRSRRERALDGDRGTRR